MNLNSRLKAWASLAVLWLVSTTGWALDQVGGVYQIGTAEDLAAFAELVNGGETDADAVLTADIDYTAYTTEKSMIGNADNYYAGTFDGQWHTVKVAFLASEANTAIIRYAGSEAVIKNLVAEGSITTGQKYAAGICAYLGGKIQNCASYVNITSTVVGDGTHAPIACHILSNGACVENCLGAGSIKGSLTTNCGGIVGWADALTIIKNSLSIVEVSLSAEDAGSNPVCRNSGSTYCYSNYYKNAFGEKDTLNIQVTDEMLADGSVCYMLNGDQTNITWWQKIGTDKLPVLAASGTQVYAEEGTIDCLGHVEGGKFSNTPNDNKPAAHDYVDGVCEHCGQFDFNYCPMEDGYYMISNASQLKWFGKMAMNGYPYVKAKLASDIEFTGSIMDNTAYFRGELDGQGHKLTIHIEALDTEKDSNPSPIPWLAGTVRNLLVSGDITTKVKYAASIASHTNSNAVVENCYSDVVITSSMAPNTDGSPCDGTHAGLVAVAEGPTTVNGCIFAGQMLCEENNTGSCGGIVGWATGALKVSNTLMVADVQMNASGSYTICRNPGNVTCSNVFYLTAMGEVNTGSEEITAEQLAGGKGCYALNGDQVAIVWYQTIGSDAMPIMDATHQRVYAIGKLRCDGKPDGELQYTNDPQPDLVVPDHHYVDGVCDVCGVMEHVPNKMEDGFYEMASAQDIVWLCNRVNKEGENDINARMTADINMSEVEGFTGIGNIDHPYKGHFDGQGHVISSLIINCPETDGVGFFSVVTSPAIIENFILDSSCSITAHAYVGLIGQSHGSFSGVIKMNNLGNEGSVTGAGANSGGIIGCNMSSAATYEIKNCYVTGIIVGGSESGQISGWVGDNAKVENCWAVASVTGIQDGRSFARFGSVTFTNCFKSGDAQDNVGSTNESEMANGELAYKLNGKSYANPVWYQNIGDDAHPLLDDTHGIVYYNSVVEEYRDVRDEESFEEFKDVMLVSEEEYCDNVMAQAILVEEYRTLLTQLGDAATMADFAKQWEEIKSTRSIVEESAKNYTTYKNKVDEISKYLEEHLDFSGEARDIVTDYVDGDGEPSELYPNGCALYIMEQCLLDNKQILAEVEFAQGLLDEAIRSGFEVGTDVTNFIANANFTQENFEGWEGKKATGYGGSNTNEMRSAECWNTTFDMYQTLTGLKNGVYELRANGACRVNQDVRNGNYIASMYANDNLVYLMTVGEDWISVDDAIDGENCNLTGGTNDMAWENEEGDTIGWVMHGVVSVCNAANGGRYQNRILANVTDGTLTIGFKSPGTGLAQDWTGFGNIHLIYQGEMEEAGEAMENTLAGQAARARYLLNADGEGYKPAEDETFEFAPAFGQDMKDRLQATLDKMDQASTPEEQYALIGEFSETFKDIYASKAAYVAMMKHAEALNAAMADLVASGIEVNTESVNSTMENMIAAYYEGSYTTEQAEALEEVKKFDFVPVAVDDTLQISNVPNLIYYSAMGCAGFRDTKAVLTTDLDMTGVAMTPIGTHSTPFRGYFDGQRHHISNFSMEHVDTEVGGTGLFGWIVPPTTIENLILDETCSVNGGKFVGGIIGASVTGYTGDIYMNNLGYEGTVNASGVNAGGIIGCCEGGSATFNINNCYVTGAISGSGESGAISGWVDTKGKLNGCWTISEVTGTQSAETYVVRPTGASLTNVYSMKGSQGSSFTEEQLADGTLTYNVNGRTHRHAAWTQVIGTDKWPKLFGGEEGIVYFVGGEYTNNRPTIAARSYAYNIFSRSHADRVDIGYSLNADAQAAEIRFYNGTELVYTHTLTAADLTAGNHAVSVDNSELPANANLKFDIRTEFYPVSQAFAVTDPVKAYAPMGLAVNNCPESPAFGNIYMVDGESDHEDYTGYISDEKTAALFAFDPLMNNILAADGKPGFTGNVNLSCDGPKISNSYNAYAPKSVRVSEDGRLFIGLMNGKTNSPIWESDQTNLDADWTPVFTGGELDEETGITYVGGEEQSRMMVSFDVAGSGSDLVLYTLAAQHSDGGFNYSDYVANTYNLGTQSSWTTTPSGTLDSINGRYTISPLPVNIVSDHNGGYWYIQYRSTPKEEQPALKHYNAEGKEDYSDVTTTCNGGGMAVSPDGSIIAMPIGAKSVRVYSVDYVPMANGSILLNPLATVATDEGNDIHALAFDYALNLYASSRDSRTMTQYTLPAAAGTEAVVPAPSAANFTVGTETAIEGITAEEIAGSDVYSLDGKLVRKNGNVKGLRGIYVVRGTKYLINE